MTLGTVRTNLEICAQQFLHNDIGSAGDLFTQTFEALRLEDSVRYHDPVPGHFFCLEMEVIRDQ
jgi:hypothetical protein